ncbi:Acb2/Tad1 domain-containing protein [Streptomyces sp. NBC_00306]|uniref:Acb2/Tad1 domain-containing protein n=1 Tax=Streptomyces sp. NBC_00306 TaxID=2975708 RepID=UPI002E2B8459|nr:hypothetical protein [Streptomyces sp. NBC_00306]
MALNDKELSVRFAVPADRRAHHEEAKERITKAAHTFAALIHDLVPGSREESEAVTSVEEAVMWAHAGIDRRHC